MSEVGRPKHNFWEEAGFKMKMIIVSKNNEEKKVNAAQCLQCNKILQNTAKSRLQGHRNICKLDIEKLKNIATNSFESNSGKCDVNFNCNKRKASRSLEPVDENNDKNNFTESDSIEISTTACTGKSASEIKPTLFSSQYNKSEEKELKCPIALTARTKSQQIKSFFDDVTPQQAQKMNEALLELLIACNIDFECIETKYMKNFIKQWRPSYEKYIPKCDVLSTELLQQVYEKHMKTKSKFKSCGILLINVQTNELISMTYDNQGKYVLVKHEHRIDDLELFIIESINVVEKDYGADSVKIYAVVFDSSSSLSLNDLDKSVYYLMCTSKVLESVVKSIVNHYDILNQVCELLEEFQIPSLQKEFISKSNLGIIPLDKNDWHTYYNGFHSCFKNYEIMRQLLTTNLCTKNKNIINLLFDKNFEYALTESALIMGFVQVTFNKRGLNYTLADLVEDWSEFFAETNENYCEILKKEFECIYNPVALAANYLHPRYQGLKFANNESYYKRMFHFLLQQLSENRMKSYFHYKGKTDEFETLFELGYQSAEVFWLSVNEKYHEDLAKLASRISRIPAFTNKISLNSFTRKNLKINNQDQISELYYLLKVNH